MCIGKEICEYFLNTFRNGSGPFFFELSGFDSICAADSTRVVVTRNLSATKIISERHVSAKCEHGIKPNYDDYPLTYLRK